MYKYLSKKVGSISQEKLVHESRRFEKLKMLFEILVALLVGLIVTTFVYLTRNYGTLEAMGIPVVKPFLIFGSPPFMFHKMKVHEHNLAMHRTLGKTFGRYSGRIPFVFTIDPEMIKEILVRF